MTTAAEDDARRAALFELPDELAIDTDGDGAITAAEHNAGARKMFDKMDKDHNGGLSAAEIQAGHDKMMTAEDQ